MKRAKVILSAVALLAVVGGALAFKATRTQHPFYSSNAAGICNSRILTTYTTDLEVAGPTITTFLSLSATTTSCPELLVKTVQ